MIQKPYNINLRGTTIDGSESNKITWQVSGDIQVAFKIDILSNVDNSLIFTTNKISTYNLKYIISPSTLLNGNEYKIEITVYNESDQSATSDTEIFQTSTRPIITVSIIGTINSFSYNFSATYTQAENEPLRNYIIYLYNVDKNMIGQSNIKTILPMEHLFSGFEPEKIYYIEFQATSSKGLTSTTGLVEFDVFYLRPKMNINLEAKNIHNAGIELSWYIVQIIGETDGSQFINNEKIDTTDGTKVNFNEGFEIEDNFTLKLWIEQPYQSNVVDQVNLVKLNGVNGTLYLQYWDNNKFHMWKDVNGLKSHWVSEEVTGVSFYVFIQQINKDINIISEVNI